MPERTLAEAFHPGEFLRDELEARAWSQVEFAEIIGRPVQFVNEVIAGKRGITPETAKAFGAALGTSAEFWMNLDTAYQLWKTAPVSPRVAQQAELRSRYPLRDMTRRGWIEASEDTQVLESRLLRYFEIKSLHERPRLVYAAKQSGDPDAVSSLQSAWLYRVKHLAESLPAVPYAKRALLNLLPELAALRKSVEDLRLIPALLAKAGVRLVIVEPLPSSKIDGACLWLGPSAPVVGLSLRFDRIDNFWFVLRHELEHVLNEDGKDLPVVDSNLEAGAAESESVSRAERKANLAAAEFCVPQKLLERFVSEAEPPFSRQTVLAFADRLGVHPGLVVGQLQQRLGRYDLFRPLLVPIRSVITPAALTDGYGLAQPA